MALLTEFQVVGTAGETVDGRTIEEQWLTDIADQYDLDIYQAQINADHERWFGNFGQVHEVRLGKNKEGATTLEARLHPNFRLIEMNRNGQRLFTSMEITPNFRGKGKAYLTGLAVTDDPASIGTSMLKFSNASVKALPQEIHFTNPGEGTETESLLKRILSAVTGNKNESFKNQPGTEPDTNEQGTDMTPEQFAQLTEQNEKIISALGALAENHSQQPDGTPDGNQGDGNANTVEEAPATVSADEFNSVKTELEGMKAEFEKLKNKPAGEEQDFTNDGDAQDIPFI